jgi:hypothetical protein
MSYSATPQHQELTPTDIMKGKMLSPETTALLIEEIQRLEGIMCSITFSSDPTAREDAILSYVEAQAKRNALAALVDESNQVFEHLRGLPEQSKRD